ncbi:MAG: Rieske 2Fe-2S domain-containing protein [Candidatus Neomarinimicrobiota bacterium]
MLKVANISDIPPLTGKVVMVEGNPVALINLGHKIIAWDNRCPHRGSSLADGIITDKVVQCRHHLWKFGTETGRALENSKILIKKYSVNIIGADIYLNI